MSKKIIRLEKNPPPLDPALNIGYNQSNLLTIITLGINIVKNVTTIGVVEFYQSTWSFSILLY